MHSSTPYNLPPAAGPESDSTGGCEALDARVRDRSVPRTLSGPAAHRRSAAQIGSTSRTLPLWEGERPFVRSSMLPSCSGWAFFLPKGTGRNQFLAMANLQDPLGTSPCFTRCAVWALQGVDMQTTVYSTPTGPNDPNSPESIRKDKKKSPGFIRRHKGSQGCILPQPGPSLSVFRRCLGRSRRAHDHISRARGESFLLLLSTASKSHAKRGL